MKIFSRSYWRGVGILVIVLSVSYASMTFSLWLLALIFDWS